ncbi:MAG: hypothetical protein IKB93_15970 [Clostridia bacterium]|nr:hypothetical protein [Clostridia bacterium]
MLRINRIKVKIFTDNGVYGFDTSFDSGLSFLASEENTCGKSSILAAVYYCLGLEEILGGKGEKVLTSAFKTTIEDGNKTWSVLQSCAYLEISNGAEVVTLFRTAKMLNRDSKMITVYYGDMDAVDNPKTSSIDTYVHFPNAAINEKGFHSFLEKFLYLELPQVTASDDSQRKLYLQLIFSCMFIEQKHGWSDLFSGMPILGIKESKKRVIEFVLKLDTLTNDKKRDQLKIEESLINKEWSECYKSLQIAAERESCSIVNFPIKPRILTETDIKRISINFGDKIVSDTVNELEKQSIEIRQLKPKVIDNFDELQVELNETEAEISKLSNYIVDCRGQLSIESGSIRTITNNLETISIDLSNNKDAARLRSLGSDLQFEFAKDICPVCHQKINDSLLPNSIDVPVMGIDDNIKHLEAQRDMLKFVLISHENHKEELEKEIQSSEARLFTLRRLAQTIRNDLYSINEEYSEAIVYKKITIEKQIESLNKLQQLQHDSIEKIVELSKSWEKYLEDKRALPKNRFTDEDKDKIALLRDVFINNLRKYGYKSILDLEDISISEESYLPLFEGFDMKFDSSASDNIRVIWAFTMALLQVSILKGGNHPTVLIFDEPDQQSTIISDMKSFFENILELTDKCQVVMGITLKDRDTKQVIDKLPKGKFKCIDVPNKAFQKFESGVK